VACRSSTVSQSGSGRSPPLAWAGPKDQDQRTWALQTARRNYKLEVSADIAQALLEVVTVHHWEQFKVRLQLPEERLRERRDCRGVREVEDDLGRTLALEGREVHGLWLPPLGRRLHDLWERATLNSSVKGLDGDRTLAIVRMAAASFG
jgi:hypothetical protein